MLAARLAVLLAALWLCGATATKPTHITVNDPTQGLLPTTSDGWANWFVVGLNAIPLTASIATNGTMTVTYSPSGALGPNQVITWLTGATVITALGTGTGGIGTYTVSPAPATAVASQTMTAAGIPVRSTIFTTLSPSGGDDTSAINTALSNCPAGQVVKLNAGVFRISGNGVIINNTSCTLRGAGPGQQLSTGLNKVNGGGTVRSCSSGTLTTFGDGSFCTDATATQLIKTDRASNTSQVVNVYPPASTYSPCDAGSSPGTGWGNIYNVGVNAVQGGYQVILATTPTDLAVGQLVLIDALTNTDPNVVFGPAFGNPPFRNCGFGARRNNSSMEDVMEIVAISGTTLTFDTPITYPYSTSFTAQLGKFSQVIYGVGLENLFVFGGTNNNISFEVCAYCWVSNVESYWSNGPSIGIAAGFRDVIRDSFIHETNNPNPGGAGYMLDLAGGTAETLVENNAIWYGDKVDVMRNAGGGNVFAYNYTDDAFGASFPDSPEAGINAAHMTTTHLALFEGNYTHNIKADTYWGNSIYITNFRNWVSTRRAAHAPLNSFTFSSGCLATYGDYNGQARGAVDLMAYSFNHNYIGNVLGVASNQLLTEPGPNPCNTAQTGFTAQISTLAQYNTCGSNNCVPMWRMGAYQPTNVSPSGTYTFSDCAGQAAQSVPNWTFDNCTVQTVTRTANWDWSQNSGSGAQVSYTFGTISTTSNPAGALPTSFYLTARPAFFGSDATNFPWPWVNPATGATTYGSGPGLPAMYCFNQGKMPTCALP